MSRLKRRRSGSIRRLSDHQGSPRYCVRVFLGRLNGKRNYKAEVLKNRAAVERWVDMHCGDFSSIKDFRADFHIGDEHIVHEWAHGEESELEYPDCMFPSEEE